MQQTHYKTLDRLLRHKHWLPEAAAAICAAAGAWGLLRTGYLEFLFAGMALGAISYVSVKAALELVHMITVRLIPVRS